MSETPDKGIFKDYMEIPSIGAPSLGCASHKAAYHLGSMLGSCVSGKLPKRVSPKWRYCTVYEEF